MAHLSESIQINGSLTIQQTEFYTLLMRKMGNDWSQTLLTWIYIGGDENFSCPDFEKRMQRLFVIYL